MYKITVNFGLRLILLYLKKKVQTQPKACTSEPHAQLLHSPLFVKMEQVDFTKNMQYTVYFLSWFIT